MNFNILCLGTFSVLTSMLLFTQTKANAVQAFISDYRVLRQVAPGGQTGQDVHFYSYTISYTGDQVAAYRTIKLYPYVNHAPWKGTQQDIAYWQTTGSGDFTNPTPPISCSIHSFNDTYTLHVYIAVLLGSAGTPNTAEDYRDAYSSQ